MTTTDLQQLLRTLIETAQSIAADAEDPVHAAVRDAANIESVDSSGSDGLTITHVDGGQLRVLIAE